MSLSSSPGRSFVVTPSWLAGRLGDPNLVVLDGSYYLPTANRDADAEYRAQHIPGALRFDIEAVADHASPYPHMLPSREAFADAVGLMGISEHDTIVCYDGLGLFSAPRVWWTFRLFGARNVYVLEGGLPRWLAEGHPVESGRVTRAPTEFVARAPADVVADVARIQRVMEDESAQIVDARQADRFNGTAAEPRPGLRSGHIPGSLNVPHATLVQNGALLPAERLREKFAAAGVDFMRPIITTCGSGVSAAVLWLALESMGISPAALYDGSWSEWGAREDLPIAKKT